jgi:hypothetical protein
MRVALDVRERLLDEAVRQRLELAGQPVREGRDPDVDTALAHALCDDVDGRTEPLALEDRRVQLDEQAANGSDDRAAVTRELCESRQLVPLRFELELEAERRELLHHVVVEEVGDLARLVLLGVHELDEEAVAGRLRAPQLVLRLA